MKFFQTFYGKISAIFLVILLILGTVQTLITMQSSSNFIAEVDQRLNLNLAADMASELKPILEESLDYQKIGERIHYMMVMNPKVEIYLLDNDGKILSFFAEPGKTVQAERVALDPINSFLSSEHQIPILGPDPRFPGQRKPFSATRIQLSENQSGYLYIIIGSEQYTTTTAEARESYLLNTLLKGLLITLILAGIVGLILFALLTKRIRNMSAVVKDFESGDYERRIPEKSDDEIGQLAHSFNQMADTIVANMEELKQTDRLRRELIANISHDLRSPLASIQGYLETILMKNSSLGPEQRNQFLEIILNDTEMLNKLVHELFELSKLEAEEKKPEKEPFAISELVQDVVMKFRDQAEKSGIELNGSIPRDLPPVYADIGMIERVLSNLIGNAIDYTPEQGKVEVSLSQENRRVRIMVRDTGPGIPDDELPHIFDRFYRVEKSPSQEKGSTGLGLAIAKKIIDLHNSAIRVESELNEGTAFFFDLETPALEEA